MHQLDSLELARELRELLVGLPLRGRRPHFRSLPMSRSQGLEAAIIESSTTVVFLLPPVLLVPTPPILSLKVHCIAMWL